MLDRIKNIFINLVKSQKTLHEFSVGDLCSVRSGKGGFRIIKVLVREPGILHIRIYKETFATRPKHIGSKPLSLGTIHDKDGFGIGHIPISEVEFNTWLPILILSESVSEEELEGYRYWKESESKG